MTVFLQGQHTDHYSLATYSQGMIESVCQIANLSCLSDSQPVLEPGSQGPALLGCFEDKSRNCFGQVHKY